MSSHMRIYHSEFPLAEGFNRNNFKNGVGFGLEFSKLFATTHGNWHTGLLFETAAFESYEERDYHDGYYHYNTLDFALYTIAATGGYTLRFSNRFFIDFSLQTGVSIEYDRYVDQLFYANASLKLGIEF